MKIPNRESWSGKQENEMLHTAATRNILTFPKIHSQNKKFFIHKILNARINDSLTASDVVLSVN